MRDDAVPDPESLLGEQIAFYRANAAAYEAWARADLFGWRSPERFDAVFFAYWLSHVPAGRFDSFWRWLADALVPGGRVFFVDSSGTPPRGAGLPGTARYREEDDCARGVSVRELDGERYRVVKVAWEPAALEMRLAALGWRASVQTGALAYWGAAHRAV
jgi:demethylmenaquinone methyltransferase/2-methoxy-6-polyprenyl-1,4-benzoquinol methylase